MSKFCTVFLSTLFCITYCLSVEASNGCGFCIWEKECPHWYIGFGSFVNDSLSGKSFSIVKSRTGNVGTINQINYDTHNPGIGFQGLIGYYFNRVLAFEFKYYQTAWPNKFFVRTIDIPDEPVTYNNQVDLKLHQIGFGPSTLFALPISPCFAPYFKGGTYILYYYRERGYDSKFDQPTTKTLKSRFWDVRFIIGYGIRSQITCSFGLRLEYECAINPVIDTLGKLIEGNINLTGYYCF